MTVHDERGASGPDVPDDPEADHYARVQRAFEACHGVSEEARAAALEMACGDDLDLRAEVEALLGVEPDEDGPFSERRIERARAELESAFEAEELGHAADWMPEAVGDYRIVGRLGAGGMGVVYEAEQRDPQRRVALKVIHPGQASAERTRRFRQEAQILGRLHHPGIAQVYESGTCDLGRGVQPFFAMELIDGVDLISWAQRQRLDLRAKLALLAEIADAVQSAHRANVVHRDLKPDNVLVDSDGRVKVLDFGIAFAAEDSTFLSTLVTEEGQILGTLAYMAPEQLRADVRGVTPRADVYALGVMAFELISGELPLDPTGLPITAGMHLVDTEDPRRLSTVYPAVPADVDTIVGKALEKEALRRYESAEALAADLRRFLADRPIAARPPSRLYRLRKYTRRHRALVGTLVTLVLGAVISTVLAFVAREQQRVAERLKDEVDTNLYITEMQLASELASEPVGALRMQELLSHWVPSAGEPDRRGWEWSLLEEISRPREQVFTGEEWVLTTEWHPTEPLIVTGERPARVYDVEAGRFVAELPTEQLSEDIAWSPSGDVVVLCAPSETRAFARDDWRPLFVWSNPTYGCGVSWHPDGSHFLLANSAGQLFRVSRDDWKARLLRTEPALLGGPGMVDHHPSGGELAILSNNRTDATVLDLVDFGQRVLPPPQAGMTLTCLSFDPAGDHLAVGAASGLVQVWRREDWSLHGTWPMHAQFVTEVSWGPDGRRLASASRDTSIQVVDAFTGQALRQLRGHRLIAEYVDWSAAGRLVSCSKDRTMRIWPAGPHGARWKVEPPAPRVIHAANLAWLPGTDQFTASLGGDVELWDAQARPPRRTGREFHGGYGSWSRDGRWLAAFHETSLLVHEPARPGEPQRLRLAETFNYWISADWHPVEANVLAVGNANRLWICRMEGSGETQTLKVSESLDVGFEVLWLEWSPDGTRVVLAGGDRLALYEHGGKAVVAGPRYPGLGMRVARWSPDGRRIVVVADDVSLRVLDPDGWVEQQQLRAHNNQIRCCAWSPDGRRLASGDQHGIVRVWDAERGRPVATLDAESSVLGLVWSSDGKRLVAANNLAQVFVWSATPKD